MMKDEKGQSLVEFAIILPLLLLLLIGIIDFGRVLYTHMHLHLTTQETVRIAGIGTRTDAQVEEFAYNHFRGDPNDLEITITPSETERKAGEYVTVNLRYPISYLTPGLSQVISSPQFISSNSTIRVEKVGSQ